MDKYFDGNKLRELRNSKGLSGRKLADAINVSQAYISKFESGKAIPDINMLGAILKVLGTDISTFFSSDEESLPLDLHEFIKTYRSFSAEEQQAFLDLIKSLSNLVNTFKKNTQ